ncbi:MAG: hypothetical protein ACO3LE_00225 [Bdellovibrionota bacterium]
MPRFFKIFGILALLAVPSLSAFGSILGQSERREDFQNSLKSFELGEPLDRKNDFRQTSEWVQWQILQQKEIEPPLGDVSTHLLGIRHLLSESIFEWQLVLNSFQSLIRELIHRPIDALRTCMEILYRLLPILLISVLTLCLFQLFIWRASIMNDLNRLLKISTHFGGLFLLTGALILGIMTKQFLFACLLFCLTAMLYSRNRRFYRRLSLILLGFILTASFWGSLYENLSFVSLKEAMNSGKNRLEYPQHLLLKLKPEEQAQWSFWNHQYLLASRLNQSAPDSLNSSLMKFVIDAQYQPARLLVDQLHQIEAQYGKNEIISFNLSQLYLKSQNLDLFDKMKNELGHETYSKLYDRSLATSAGILPPKTDIEWGDAFLQAAKDFLQGFSQLWRSASISSFLIQMILFFLPLVIFLIFLFLSQKTSGLCQETGRATNTHDEFLSTTSIHVLEKRDQLHLAERKQWKNQQLFYKEQLKRLIQFWIWIVPGAYQLEKGSYGRALALNLLVYLTLWGGLSSLWRSEVLNFFGFQQLPQFLAYGTSFSLLIFGLLLLTFNALWGVKKASSI